MKVGDRVITREGQEGMVLLRLTNGDYVVRHLCENHPQHYWDCYHKRYSPDKIRPIGPLLALWRFFSPGYLSTQEYRPDHGYPPEDIIEGRTLKTQEND